MRAILEPGALEVKEVGEQPVKSLFLASMKDTREDRAQRKKSDTNWDYTEEDSLELDNLYRWIP